MGYNPLADKYIIEYSFAQQDTPLFRVKCPRASAKVVRIHNLTIPDITSLTIRNLMAYELRGCPLVRRK